MTQTLGELLLQSGNPLLKMWSIDVKCGNRPFVKHSHTRFEITVINSGSGEYTTENAVYPMLPGDVFVFSSNEVHCITKSGDEGLNITNLHFEPRYLSSDNREAFDDNFIDFCFSHSKEFQNRIPAEKANVIKNYHTMIKNEFLASQNEYSIAVKSYLNLILIELLRNHNYRSAALANNKNNLFDILSVYNYIEKNLSCELTLGLLSEIAGLSPNYFSHIFKQLNGISLWDYITAKRIEKATHLICNSEYKLTMLDIALQCGFNNTVNFNKAFKKHKGITPSQLRKNPKILSH